MKGFELIAHQIAQLTICLTRHNEIINRFLDSFSDNELLDKSQAMNILKISDSSYKRWMKDGIITAMKLPGGDRFFKRDLLKALEESRNKGKF